MAFEYQPGPKQTMTAPQVKNSWLWTLLALAACAAAVPTPHLAPDPLLKAIQDPGKTHDEAEISGLSPPSQAVPEQRQFGSPPLPLTGDTELNRPKRHHCWKCGGYGGGGGGGGGLPGGGGFIGGGFIAGGFKSSGLGGGGYGNGGGYGGGGHGGYGGGYGGGPTKVIVVPVITTGLGGGGGGYGGKGSYGHGGGSNGCSGGCGGGGYGNGGHNGGGSYGNSGGGGGGSWSQSSAQASSSSGSWGRK